MRSLDRSCRRSALSIRADLAAPCAATIDSGQSNDDENFEQQHTRVDDRSSLRRHGRSFRNGHNISPVDATRERYVVRCVSQNGAVTVPVDPSHDIQYLTPEKDAKYFKHEIANAVAQRACDAVRAPRLSCPLPDPAKNRDARVSSSVPGGATRRRRLASGIPWIAPPVPAPSRITPRKHWRDIN